MAFQSVLFLSFLSVTAVFCLLAGKKSYAAGKVLLLLASFVFYGMGGWKGLCVLLPGAAVTFGVSRYLLSGRGQPAIRKTAFVLAVVWQIGVLMAFKYTGFLTGDALKISFVPLGLSFFTFQQLWFLKEVWTGELSGPEAVRLRGSDFALFSLFFPTVTAGPILRPAAFFPQILSDRFLRPDWDDAAAGLYAISIGMGKKVLLADTLGVVVNNGYAHLGELTAPAAWLIILGYTFQLYFDFSGYCEIAAGAARLLGIRLPINFDAPYRSLSVGEFWKRWHITLTTFLRECLYFPLGGSRHGAGRAYLNILIVFLISGFWHGAGWTFLFWGLLHGLAQVAERAWGSGREKLPKLLRWGLTFFFVNLAWVFFRAPDLSAAWGVLSAAFKGGAGIPIWLTNGFLSSESEALGILGLLGKRPALWLMALVYLLAGICALRSGNTLRRMDTFRPTIWRCVAVCVLLAASILSFSSVTTFIYANF